MLDSEFLELGIPALRIYLSQKFKSCMCHDADANCLRLCEYGIIQLRFLRSHIKNPVTGSVAASNETSKAKIFVGRPNTLPV